MPRRFTKEGENRVIAAYQSGVSLSDLGRQEGCCLEAVRKVLIRHGVERRPRGATARNLSPELREQLIADYKGGMSQIPLSKKYGVSQVSVSRYLRSAGVKMNLAGAAASGFQKCGGRIQIDGRTAILTPTDSPYSSMRNHLGYILEHRLVMAEHLGRSLTPYETVHHKDGDKQNNALSNLELRQGNHGKGARFRCADCGSHNVEAY
jgi:transposase-like protein